MITTGKITFWQIEKSFGFIMPDDGGASVFAHISAFEPDVQPYKGDRVRFERWIDPRNGREKAIAVVITEQRGERS